MYPLWNCFGKIPALSLVPSRPVQVSSAAIRSQRQRKSETKPAFCAPESIRLQQCRWCATIDGWGCHQALDSSGEAQTRACASPVERMSYGLLGFKKNPTSGHRTSQLKWQALLVRGSPYGPKACRKHDRSKCCTGMFPVNQGAQPTRSFRDDSEDCSNSPETGEYNGVS